MQLESSTQPESCPLAVAILHMIPSSKKRLVTEMVKKEIVGQMAGRGH